MKGSLEDPTWGWAFRVMIIAAILWLFAGLLFGCERTNKFFAERSGAPAGIARLQSLLADGMQIVDRGGLVYVLDRKRELCFAAIEPYRVLTPLPGRDCYRLLVDSAREALEE